MIFYFIAVSLTFALAVSDIAERFKPKAIDSFWGKAARCPQCIGFWSSLALGYTSLDPFIGVISNKMFSMLACGITGSFVCFATGIILTRIQYGPQV